MSQEIIKDMIDDVKKKYGINSVFSDKTILNIIKDDDLAEYFFSKIKIDENKLKKYLKLKRDLSLDKSYIFEKKILNNWLEQGETSYSRLVLLTIPDKYLVNDKDFIINMLEKNKGVLHCLTLLTRSKLEKEMWFIDKIIDLKNFEAEFASDSFPWKNVEITKRVISNKVENFLHIPIEFLKNEEIFHHSLDCIYLANKNKLWKHNNKSHHYPRVLLQVSSRIVEILEEIEEKSSKKSSMLSGTTFENFKSMLISLSCVHPRMDSEDLKKVMNNRLKLFRYIDLDDLGYVNKVDLLVKDINEKMFEDCHLRMHLVNCVKEFMNVKGLESIPKQYIKKTNEYLLPHVSKNNPLSNLLLDIQKNKYSFLSNKDSSIIAKDFNQVSDLLKNINIYLLQELLDSSIPKKENKVIVRKF